jgi:hypothetical protein
MFGCPRLRLAGRGLHARYTASAANAPPISSGARRRGLAGAGQLPDPTSRSTCCVELRNRAVRDGRRGHSGGVESHIVFVVTTRKSISERFVQLIYEQVI